MSFGISSRIAELLCWTIVVIGITLLVYVANQLCKRVLIPLIRKLTRETATQWDDVILNDTLLNDVSRLFAPIIIAWLLPMAFEYETPMLDFLLRVNYIYMLVIVAKLICSLLNAVYELSSQNDKLKNHPLKGMY